MNAPRPALPARRACAHALAAAVLAAVALPATAHAQQAATPAEARGLATQDTARATFTTALATLPQAERAEVLRVLDSARTDGSPAAPLERKVVEGVAKQAPPDRIIAAIRSLAAALRTARATLGPGASEAELTAAAAAVQAGIAPGLLSRVRASLSQGRSATQALVVLTDLARRGVPPADAAGAVARLARAGAADGAFAAFRARVASDMAAGTAPRAALARQTDALFGAPARSPVVSPLPGPLDP